MTAVLDIEGLSPTFQQDLLASQRAVAALAAHLVLQGHHITVPEVQVAENPKDWASHLDNGDIIITRNGQDYRVEVKWVNTPFIDKDSFPYSRPIVDVAATFERKQPKPRYYFMLNPNLTHYAWLDVLKTQRLWAWVPKKERGGRERVFIVCPKGVWSWGRLLSV